MENSENKYSFDLTILKALIERGPDFLTEPFRFAINEVMKLERENFLNAGAYKRSKNRPDYANDLQHAARTGHLRHLADPNRRFPRARPKSTGGLFSPTL